MITLILMAQLAQPCTLSCMSINADQHRVQAIPKIVWAMWHLACVSGHCRMFDRDLLPYKSFAACDQRRQEEIFALESRPEVLIREECMPIDLHREGMPFGPFPELYP